MKKGIAMYNEAPIYEVSVNIVHTFLMKKRRMADNIQKAIKN